MTDAMKQTRPILSVYQSSSEDRQIPSRSTTTSTTAAWHRANSHLETFGTFRRHEHQHRDTAIQNEYDTIDPERQPLVNNNDLRDADAVQGGSTLTQTILNSMNSLLGVGLLSLPLGFLYSGWIIGGTLLTAFALLTSYTATLLAECMKHNPSCRSYIDIAYIAYGKRGRSIVVVLFSLITITACVALVILFADSMNALIPSLTITQWKLICGAILLPLHFAPFHILSMASMVGIAACFGTVTLLIVAGVTAEPDQSGSLFRPAATTLLPLDWAKMPLSLGLLMSPWTAHAILPNLYRDMAEPGKFGKATRWAFGGTYVIDVAIATSGYLMYGEATTDEITNNVIAATKSRSLAIVLTVLVALMPISKVPLTARPLVVMMEYALGYTEANIEDGKSQKSSMHRMWAHFCRCAIRILWIIVLTCGAITAPDFSLVMAFMGSAMCYTIAIILPLLFYLRLFGQSFVTSKTVALWTLIVLSSIAALVGTVWAFIG